jgi:hypothetical protein
MIRNVGTVLVFLFWVTVVVFMLVLMSRTTADGQELKVYRFWSKAELTDLASVHASKQPRDVQPYLQYFDAADIPPVDREPARQVLSYALNSLSTNDLITQPQEVPGSEGALFFIDIRLLRERGDDKGVKLLRINLDRLGDLGSGAAPFTEPYYHALVDSYTEDQEVKEAYQETYKAYETRQDSYGGRYYVEVTRTRTAYRTKTVKGKRYQKTVLGAHLNRATAGGLSAVTKTLFPIFVVSWFLTNALSEPRYHELLGLDDSEESVRKLAGVDDKTVERVGAQLRGAVLWSDVAHHNRILERRPTPQRKGRGSIHVSFDFKTSVNLQDVLKDVLIKLSDAKEIIFTLPNGLQGFFVVDNKDNRLDKADADVALNNRSRFRDRQVRTAFHCMACHLPDRGWIEVDDEVRNLASTPITLFADAVSKGDKKRGDRVRQQYLDTDYNELIQADQAVVEVAVAAATKSIVGRGMTCPQTAKFLTDTIYQYAYEPVSLQSLAAYLGCPQDEALAALQIAGNDPVFVILRKGGRARRDQVEAGFARLAALMYLGKHLEVKR